MCARACVYSLSPFILITLFPVPILIFKWFKRASECSMLTALWKIIHYKIVIGLYAKKWINKLYGFNVSFQQQNLSQRQISEKYADNAVDQTHDVVMRRQYNNRCAIHYWAVIRNDNDSSRKYILLCGWLVLFLLTNFTTSVNTGLLCDCIIKRHRFFYMR